MLRSPDPGLLRLDRPRSALVVEGGGLRTIFAAGILDRFIELDFLPFDACFGVSAGAGALAGYLAEMPTRTHKILLDYSLRPEFISTWRFLRGGHLLDLDWLWPLTVSEVPLDMATIYGTGRPFFVGMTDVESGQAVHLATHAENLVDALKASSALPLLYRGFPLVEGRAMTDGGVTDPIPLAKAIEWGARRIMVIRSRPKNYRKRENKMESMVLKALLRERPALANAARGRAERYNRAIGLIRRPPVGVTVIEASPSAKFKVGRTGRNAAEMQVGYELGKLEADNLVRVWNALA